MHNPAFGRRTGVLAKEFFDLADVPLEIKWFANNLMNPQTQC
jgi:hypothetical protein